nr:MAG TPA: hypothetical protein [Caudoviricetes sp.]DAR51101.1 MAG TPA: hypothetical protein [Caudoviricetes sp.]
MYFKGLRRLNSAIYATFTQLFSSLLYRGFFNLDAM